jgi:dual adaptor for phosphotyrosine/3-phosphotyrosine/3-phosphoinositide
MAVSIIKTDTLHREKELIPVTDLDEGNNLSPPPFQVLRKTDKPTHHEDHHNTAERRELTTIKYTKDLRAAKDIRAMAHYPNPLDIPWYHPSLTRHVAESILLSKNTLEGTYLLRCSSSQNDWTLSARCKDTVKHYKVNWDGKYLKFGLGKFKTTAEFMEHFESHPVISGDSGFMITLSHPYPRDVSEFIEYIEPIEFGVLDETQDGHNTETSEVDLSLNTKSGYLTKLGGHRKNWKLRWFKLIKNELSYYSTKDSPTPLRTIKLSDAISVSEDKKIDNNFHFRLVTTYRIFFMYTASESEMKEWIEKLQWKINRKNS